MTGYNGYLFCTLIGLLCGGFVGYTVGADRTQIPELEEENDA